MPNQALKFKRGAVLTLALLWAGLTAGCMSINSDITVEAGEQVSGSRTTVNGSIRVGADAVVDGDVSTVNGGIHIDSGAQVRDAETVNGKVTLGVSAQGRKLSTVNGAIEVHEDARVTDSIEAVNGRVVVQNGARVEGQISSVNGQIMLDGGRAGSLTNLNGGMLLRPGSRVDGELRVRSKRGDNEPVMVEIHADCEVVGPLVFERNVRLRIHRDATVGEIRGAEPEYFDSE